MSQQTEETSAQIGRAVRKLRRDLGWKQDVLASESGLNRATISAIERGQVNTSIANLEKLAIALGTNLSGLLVSGRRSVRLVDKSLTEVVAKNIEAGRKFLGLSRKELAEKSGFLPQYLSTTENARRLPSLRNFLKFSRALSFSPALLLTSNLSKDQLATFCDTVIHVEDISSNMRVIRLAAGLTLFQISTMTGLSSSNYSEVETGKHEPTLQSVVAFCNGLYLSLEEIFSPS